MKLYVGKAHLWVSSPEFAAIKASTKIPNFHVVSAAGAGRGSCHLDSLRKMSLYALSSLFSERISLALALLTLECLKNLGNSQSRDGLFFKHSHLAPII
jgi:hypothetical protein